MGCYQIQVECVSNLEAAQLLPGEAITVNDLHLFHQSAFTALCCTCGQWFKTKVPSVRHESQQWITDVKSFYVLSLEETGS